MTQSTTGLSRRYRVVCADGRRVMGMTYDLDEARRWLDEWTEEVPGVGLPLALLPGRIQYMDISDWKNLTEVGDWSTSGVVLGDETTT